MIPRYGKPPLQKPYTRRPGVYAILPRAGGFVVTRQSEPEPEIQLPGGGIDPGEQPLSALHREVYEETGWSIAAPQRLGAFRHFTFMPEYGLWAEKICHIYVAHPVRQLGHPSEKHHVVLWLDAQSALASLASDGARAMLARYLGRWSGM